MTTELTTKKVLLRDLADGSVLIPYTGNEVVVETGLISFDVTTFTSPQQSVSFTLDNSLSSVKSWYLESGDSHYKASCDLVIGEAASTVTVTLTKINWNKDLEEKIVSVYYMIEGTQ